MAFPASDNMKAGKNEAEVSETNLYTRRNGSASNSSSSDGIPFADEKGERRFIENVGTLEPAERTFTTFEATGEVGRIFKKDGQLVLIPAPTNDPRDPLNLPFSRKFLGLFFLCFFGALAASAELILGAMLPVFALQYANVNPKILGQLSASGGFAAGSNPLALLQNLPGAPPLWKTYLLASLPVLMIGVANLLLIPMAIAVGRRPVILTCGVIAIGGAMWAGFSQSLESHIAARVVQALGAGTVESLIPFILQDMVFFHQRNTAISGIFAAQGTIIIALGIASPYLILNLTWRWVYYITASGAAFFLVGVFFFMPETRYYRSKDELKGIPRPDDQTEKIPRTTKFNLAFQSGKLEFRKGLNALLDSLRTFFYPHMFFFTLLNSAMIGSAFTAGYTVTPALLTKPYSWPFLHLGFSLFPTLIAAVCIALVTGKLADVLANSFAKKTGRRLPENQLVNLILPVAASIAGSILFGFAGANQGKLPWEVLLLGLGLMSFGFLGANTVGAVYVLECYPQLAGPALVNIASFRCIIAFVLSFKASEWIIAIGYFHCMIIFTSIMVLFALFIPVVYFYGPAWRRRWPGPDR